VDRPESPESPEARETPEPPTVGPAALSPAERGALVAAATAARRHAYAPYSHFAVGAAVLAEGGIHAGANVENASYGLSMCAERSAVFGAASAGARTVRAVAIVTDTATPTPPCGACRQVLREFGPDLVVVSATLSGLLRERHLSDLLPDSFGPENL
jgi:cytidine deaminase